MPATSEGYAPSGLPSNSAVSRDELDPFQFDQQTAVIFLARLNRLLNLPASTTMVDAFARIVQLREANIRLHTRIAEVWQLFHSRFVGLRNGESDTWEQAFEDLAREFKAADARIVQLTEENRKLLARADALAGAKAPEQLQDVFARLEKLELAVNAELPGLRSANAYMVDMTRKLEAIKAAVLERRESYSTRGATSQFPVFWADRVYDMDALLRLVE